MQKMNPLIQRNRFSVLGIVAFLSVSLLLILPGWAEEKKVAPVNMQKLLIVKFKNMAEVYGNGASIKSPISHRVFRSGKVPDNAADIMTSHVIKIVRERGQFIILPSSKTPIIASGILKKSGKKYLSERKLLVETGRLARADLVMSGYVYRFAERVGRTYAAEKPASVAFGLHLIRVKDGRILWSRHFDETQKALSENLFKIGTFFKRGGKWVTAEEMARIALEDMI